MPKFEFELTMFLIAMLVAHRYSASIISVLFVGLMCFYDFGKNKNNNSKIQ